MTNTVTIGIIARNEAYILPITLEAVSKVLEEVDLDVRVILVDSSSEDETFEKMIEFSKMRDKVSIVKISGNSNASLARNSVLQHREKGHLFLLDADVEINSSFLNSALEIVNSKKADCVFGSLPEIYYDYANNLTNQCAEDFYKIEYEGYRKTFFGVVFLSETVASSGLRYDLCQRRAEDIDFGFSVSENFKILAITKEMGVHHSVKYNGKDRLGDFIRSQYFVPVGRLIRKNIYRPSHLLSIASIFRGYVFGLIVLLILSFSILFANTWLAVITLIIMFIDFSYLCFKKRSIEYLPLRIVGPLQILFGLFLRGDCPSGFTIERLKHD